MIRRPLAWHFLLQCICMHIIICSSDDAYPPCHHSHIPLEIPHHILSPSSTCTYAAGKFHHVSWMVIGGFILFKQNISLSNACSTREIQQHMGRDDQQEVKGILRTHLKGSRQLLKVSSSSDKLLIVLLFVVMS